MGLASSSYSPVGAQTDIFPTRITALGEKKSRKSNSFESKIEKVLAAKMGEGSPFMGVGSCINFPWEDISFSNRSR